MFFNLFEIEKVSAVSRSKAGGDEKSKCKQDLRQSHFQLSFYQFIAGLIRFNLLLSPLALMAPTFCAMLSNQGCERKHINLKVFSLS